MTFELIGLNAIQNEEDAPPCSTRDEFRLRSMLLTARR